MDDLSEIRGEDYARGETYKFIHDKLINNKVSYSKRTINDEIF